MSLIRVSEKKIAANRANGRKSQGPSTPAGKDRSSRNACTHHLYARKFTIHPVWQQRIAAIVGPAIESVENPLEREPLARYLFLMQWIEELASFETRLLNQSIARHHGDFARGVHHFATTSPLFLAIGARRHALHRQANRARLEWKRAQRQTTPNVVEKKPLTMAAAAGASAARQSPQPATAPKCRNTSRTHTDAAATARHPPRSSAYS